MFNFFRRKTISNKSAIGRDFPPLHFKDGNAALEYACRYMECSLNDGSLLPALVLDSRELFGTQTVIMIQDDGNQLAMLRVASRDGGFIVAATTANPKGPKLLTGQLVAWKAIKYVPTIAEKSTDKRFGWTGLIMGTLKPVYINGSWIGDERFST